MTKSENLVGYRRYISLNSRIVFLIILLCVGTAFFSIGSFSFGIELVLFSIIIIFLKFSKHLNGLYNPLLVDVLLSLFFCFGTLFLFMMSNRYGETDFNAPIHHVTKFICLFNVHVMSISFKDMSRKFKRIILEVTFLIIFISSVVSVFYVMTEDPYAIRYYAERGFVNVLDFNQFYSVVFLVPILLAYILYEKQECEVKFSIPIVILLGTVIFCIAVSLYATAILFTIIAVGLMTAWHLRERCRKVFLIILLCGILCLLIMLLFNEPISDLIYDFTADFNWIIRDRIRSVADSVLGTDHNLGYTYDRRNELASYSLDTFYNNVLFGCGYENYRYGVIGCHQEWPDMLGVFGLCGTCLFLCVMYSVIKSIYKTISHKLSRNCYLISLVLLFIFGFLNPCLSQPILIVVFLIAPNIDVLLKKQNE